MVSKINPRRDATHPRERFRRGFTLLELVAVVTLVGILATVGMARFGRGTLGNVGAQGDSRRISLDLLQARRRAISTGDDHYLKFLPAGGPYTSFAVYRVGSPDLLVESVREIPTGVTVTPSSETMQFTFEGTASAAYTVTVAGPDRTWTVSVIPATGSVRVVESP